MRVLCVLMVLACVVLAGCSKSDSESPPQATQGEAGVVAEKLIYYTCPMDEHKDVHSSEPGTCPKCGMALVKAVTTSEDKMDFYGCPMEIHSHVRGEEPGKCPECGMALKPMRLVKNEG